MWELKDAMELTKKEEIRQAGTRADMGKGTVPTACMSGPWKQMREDDKAKLMVNASHHPPMVLYNGFIFLHEKYLGEDNLES